LYCMVGVKASLQNPGSQGKGHAGAQHEFTNTKL
jgi:hypothetical protein